MSQETIIFVHGAWHGKWCWDQYFRKAFEDAGYNVVTFDLPGHGVQKRSWLINRFTIGCYVKALKSEIKRLDKLPILIGHSMGGLVVQKYLEKNPCNKAILLASLPPRGSWFALKKFLKEKNTWKALLSFYLYFLVDNEQRTKRFFLSEGCSSEEQSWLSNNLGNESIRVFFKMLRPKVKYSAIARNNILILKAENDKIFGLEDHQNLKDTYPSADHEVIPDVAHDMMLDTNHKMVSDTIINWLKKP